MGFAYADQMQSRTWKKNKKNKKNAESASGCLGLSMFAFVRSDVISAMRALFWRMGFAYAAQMQNRI